MTERSVGSSAAAAVGTAAHAIAERRPLGRLRPMTVWAAAVVLWTGMGVYFWQDEGSLLNILFTAGVTASLVAFATLLTRRVLLATLLVTCIVAMIVAAASAKHDVMGMVVHAYDPIFYLTSWSTINYLWTEQTHYVLGAAAALLLTALVVYLGHRLDGTHVKRSRSAPALALAVLAAWYGATSKEERRHMQFYFSNLFVSSFYASWGETVEALWRGALIEAGPPGMAPAFTLPTRCDTDGKPPHIVLIHEESLVQPSLFPTLDYDRSVDDLFRSYDGTVHRMRVETYGGASWLTEFSLLAGVSTYSFGRMRQFVQTFMQGRLKDTLPQSLERCGYRNVVFYPMLKNFVSNYEFYTSIGMREVFDLRAQGATTAQERDRFYFNNAMNEMARHFKASDKPLFTFIQTMSAHWPYSWTFAPEVDVPGGGPGTDPEMHEYLRRVALAKIDYDYLIGEIKRRFPDERFLIVHYGDHHPLATRSLLGFGHINWAEDIPLDPESLGFVTYYAVEGVNYDVPDVLPNVDTLDVPYLGGVILRLAGLPLSDAQTERMRLMRLCQGRYYSCDDRDQILRFHRRLIDSGIVAAG